jgi:hypothetical protein
MFNCGHLDSLRTSSGLLSNLDMAYVEHTDECEIQKERENETKKTHFLIFLYL